MPSIQRLVAVAVAAMSLATVLPAQDAVAKELMRLEDQWGAAQLKRDGATVAPMLSDNYLGITRKGEYWSKAQVLKSITDDTTSYVSGANSKMKVQAHGNTVVLVGVWTQVKKTAKGNVTEAVAYTDVWIKQADGKWQCASSASQPITK
jgi:ketosteroid isomerase-like protein